ncbi:MAG: inosine/xanthosine triphosphatase [Thermoproteales archaeon]|nr:inosine/xanthosine triphosphatase [Thermoproteales archaeon]
MLVAIGSENPVKVKAIQNVFEYFFDGIAFKSLKISTSVEPQPMGLEETLIGAIERALYSLREIKADLGVGIEAGLIKATEPLKGFLNQQICAIVDSKGFLTLGFSQPFQTPPQVVEGLLSLKAREMEEILEDITGIKGIGEKEGAIGYLTNKLITRYDLCMQAVASALIPRLNRLLYSSSEMYNAMELLKWLKEKRGCNS